MRLKNFVLISLCLFGLCSMTARAQLSTNKYKFLGNITTRNSVNGGGGADYSTLWNQLTPENETKWASIEGTRDSYNWYGSDNAYNYCKQHNIPFKFHCLIWGSQYPSWMDNLSTKEQYEEIVEWMDAVKSHYPDLKIIDVVNEAVAGHAPAPYKNALGGDGKTGFDWIIKAFEMAHDRWPDAILIYNDYNTFQWQKTQFIDLVKTLRDAGAPIDAYGCQSHDLTDMSVSDFKSAMEEIQNALRMPMYSTEYDIGTTDDALQKQRYEEQIPYMWEASYCGGITLWGYIYGATWTTDGNSGIIKNGQDRPAMTWLRSYMKTDKAKNAVGPFPGGNKTHELYIKPAEYKISIGNEASIALTARILSDTIDIDSINLYVNNKLVKTFKSAPYVYSYTPKSTSTVSLKAVMYDDKGGRYERLGGFTVVPQRTPYKGVIVLPGIIEAEDFDVCADGISYHDSNSNKEGDASNYRTDGGIDIVRGNNGYALGYTNSGEWMEYTVDVKEEGVYEYEAVVSSGTTNSGFDISVNDGNGNNTLASIKVPQTANSDWSKYITVKGRFSQSLKVGQQIIRVTITGSSCNIDKIKLTKVDINRNIRLSISATPSPATVNKSAKLSVTTATSDSGIRSVEIYAGGTLLKTITKSPYEVSYVPTATGTISIQAIATDTMGAKSEIYSYNLVVYKARSPYNGAISIPGIIQAENFDKGQDGLTYHDSDNKNEGDAVNPRTDSEGVDLGAGNGGTVIGYTVVNEWLEYTVNVKTAGKYSYTATVSSGLDGSGFRLSLMGDSASTTLANISVPNTGSWDTYRTVNGNISGSLMAGQQIFRITITGAYCNIDKIELKCTLPDGVEQVLDVKPIEYDVYTLTGIRIGSIQGGDNISERLYNLIGRRGVYILRNTELGVSETISIR